MNSHFFFNALELSPHSVNIRANENVIKSGLQLHVTFKAKYVCKNKLHMLFMDKS